jgi:hypothetical protein
MKRMWLRMRVWWQWPVLTRELAEGGDPDARPELTVLARQLIGRPTQHRLADALERILATASRRSRPPTKVPLNRHEIFSARDELAALVERLREGTPAPVRGLAMATLLVHDGASPLYGGRPAQDVWGFARETRERLDDPIV